jgi:hypothetical protein
MMCLLAPQKLSMQEPSSFLETPIWSTAHVPYHFVLQMGAVQKDLNKLLTSVL